MKRKEKKVAKQKKSTRQLIGIDHISDHSLLTGHGELVFFIIKPTNISVLSETNITARIYALMTVLKGMTELEVLCINSRENFEENKRYLKLRIESERISPIRQMLEHDLINLDRLQLQMATAREFLVIIRLKNENEAEVFPYLSRIEKSLKDQGFKVHRADGDDLKRMLGVYFEQNVSTERFEEYDGERWVIIGE